MSAKDLRVEPLPSQDANRFVQRVHYSGKIVQNSCLHLGVFIAGGLHGVMQFGPSMDKRKLWPLVTDTPWHGFLELNRMAFDSALPRNSESRALGVAFRLFRKHYAHVQWIVSFADGTQCGDGTIYRASGFALTGITVNRTRRMGAVQIPGFQMRYIKFLDPTALARLTVPVIPFSEIERRGASMYRGQTRVKVAGVVVPPPPGRFDTDPPAPL